MAADPKTTGLTTYTLTMREPCGGSETVEIEAATLEDAVTEGEERTRGWTSEGDYGHDGASIEAWWVLEEDGEEVKRGCVTVEIEPDHDYLIRRAGGDPGCDHDWTSEGEGGCSENPGVWSCGGTAMRSSSHCRCCGLIRVERITGSQRNPGEHDTVEYTQPESWCAECQSEECECEAEGDE